MDVRKLIPFKAGTYVIVYFYNGVAAIPPTPLAPDFPCSKSNLSAPIFRYSSEVHVSYLDVLFILLVRVPMLNTIIASLKKEQCR